MSGCIGERRQELLLRRCCALSLHVATRRSFLLHIGDDSMEPTLSDGDEVLVDASDHGSRLRDGIYVLRSDDTLVVKRIAIKPGGRQITIASDNPAYPTWHDMDRSEVHVVGRVIWFGRAL